MRSGQLLADRFMLERLAGRGGMGEVYRAHDRRTGRLVALKVLRGQQDSDVARFEREARILAGLDHPLVVRHVAHGALPTGEPYLAMEWLDGEDLAARLARERLDAGAGVALAARVAEAIGALHERGIVHRDLKPSNVFLVDGRLDGIKLLDLGLARMDTATRMTDAGTLLGTVAYMAPEQARGAEGLDARADVFALGCLLFECLTGQTPFAAAHATAVLTKILFEDTPRLGQRLPGAPAALEALLARMLSKRPEERPRDGRAAAEALAALGTPRLEPVRLEDTVEQRRPLAITDSEQRAVAVLLIAPAPAVPATHDATPMTMQLHQDVDALRAVASAHGGRLQPLLDGSAAVLLSGTQVATDLAAQAARCALALGREAPGQRIALAMGQSELAGQPPVGPAIEQAVRLLSVARSPAHDAHRAPILLDDAMVGLLDARFRVRDDSGVMVLVGERDASEVRPLFGKPTPCVGRERELRQLEALFEDCVQGGGAQAVLVTAPPGVGKSRLGRELVQVLRARGVPVALWSARGDALRAGSPFGLMSGLLQSACGLRGGEPIEVRRDRLSARVAERIAAPERERVAEFLGELIGAPFPDEQSLPLRAARGDAQLMSDQIRAACLDCIAAECRAQPVLLLLDDLHWGDAFTVRLLDAALRTLEEAPLFLLALARPEIHEAFPRLWQGRSLLEINLRALPRNAAERLVRHVLGDGVEPETSARLVELSEGNAFYLEELIRWTAEMCSGELPRTVVAMVESRLGMLEEESRRLLRAASVFGEELWAGAVAALLGRERDACRARLAELVERELLVKRKDSRFPGEEEYTFRHALLREGAYAMLTERDRMLGHRLAAEWLVARGEQDALLLAEHFEKGRDEERAGRSYLRAAEQMSWTGDTETALAYVQRGLACQVSGELRIQLLGALCEMHYFHAVLMADALPYANEILQEAPRGSAPWAQAMLVELLCAIQSGRLDEFAASLRAVVAADPSPGAVRPLTLALAIGQSLFDALGRTEEAGPVSVRLAEIAAALGEREPWAGYFWHFNAGLRAACVMDDPASGLRHSQAALAIGQATLHRVQLGGPHRIIGMNGWFLGRGDDAERILRTSPVNDDELGHAASLRPFTLAWLLAERGALEEAREWAAGLVAAGQARRIPLDEGRGRWVLAEVLRRAGDLDAAEAELQAAMPLLAMSCPVDVPGAQAVLAATLLAQGRALEALAVAEQALARCQVLGVCSLFFRGSFLRLVHAECLEATGNQEAARAAIASARGRLFVIADKIDDPLHRTSFLADVPENRRIIELARQWLGEDPRETLRGASS